MVILLPEHFRRRFSPEPQIGNPIWGGLVGGFIGGGRVSWGLGLGSQKWQMVRVAKGWPTCMKWLVGWVGWGHNLHGVHWWEWRQVPGAFQGHERRCVNRFIDSLVIFDIFDKKTFV